MAHSKNRTYTILDFGLRRERSVERFWILKALPIGSFRNSNVSSLSPIGIRDSPALSLGGNASSCRL
jgi:nicotinic acid phosphoribosyltransferase